MEDIWRATVKKWGVDQADRYTVKLTAAFEALAERLTERRPATTSGRDIVVVTWNAMPYTSVKRLTA